MLYILLFRRWIWSVFSSQIYSQDKRISVVDALAHPYLDEGRLRYHSCMCKCCYTSPNALRQYTADFEPVTPHPFDDLWERKLTSVQQVKGTWLLESMYINIKNQCFVLTVIYYCFHSKHFEVIWLRISLILKNVFEISSFLFWGRKLFSQV